jgi:phosphatidylglycerophosphate synthase
VDDPRAPHSLDVWPTFLHAAGTAIRNAGPLALIALVVVVPTTLFMALGCPTLLAYMFTPPEPGTVPVIPASEWLVLAGTVVFMLGLGTWVYATVSIFSDAVLAGEPRPGIRAAFGRALDRVPDLFLTYLAMFAIVMTGTLLCILPGVWLSIALVVAPVRTVIARRPPGAALREAFELTKERWWRVFGYMIVVGIAVQAVYLPLSMPVAFMSTSGEGPPPVLAAILIAVSSLLGMFQQVCLVALHRRLEELGPVTAFRAASAESSAPEPG